jgi:hypothetical protein
MVNEVRVAVMYAKVPVLRREARTDELEWDWETQFKPYFEKYSRGEPLHLSEQQQMEALTAATVGRMEHNLWVYSDKSYERVRHELQASPVRDAAVSLSGAKALLEAFISLGMPLALGATTC